MATLTFWGGVGTVTGSKYLVETEQSRVLVDCGIFQGLKALREKNWQPVPFSARDLDAIVITHAHIDHTGFLPRMIVEGFRGAIYCSKGTAELLKILLPDSARLQEEEAEYRNKHQLTHHAPALPLYTEKDAYQTLEYLHPIANEKVPISVAKGVTAEFYPAGHLLGSRSVRLTLQEGDKRILFSGDLGHQNPLILRDPADPAEADYVLVESTYGDRLHDQVSPKEALAQALRRAIPREGTILIPAFAVGRTQEVLYVLRQLEDEGRIPILPVYVDSPMATEASEVYARLQGEFDPALLENNRLPMRTMKTQFAATRAQSRRLNDLEGARIIISASGMMTGGRVLHHAQRVLPNRNDTIIFVGFQAAGTTGRRILEREPVVRIFKQEVPVRCHIERVEGFSSHPDYEDILAWLRDIPKPPSRVFLTHGEPTATQSLATKIEERFGWKTHLPQYGEIFTL
jgi:metallo-beta-lactamase family protein